MDTTYILGPNGELYHWGIKGMKWGQRRYQNKDGSLTPEGKKRYDDSDGEQVKPAKKKSAKDMTDEELSRAIARARAEDEYNRLRPDKTDKKPSFVKNFMEGAVKPALINSGRKAIEDSLNKAVKNLLGDKVDPNSLDALRKTREKLEEMDKIRMLKKGKKDSDYSIEDQVKLAKHRRDEEARREGYKDYDDKVSVLRKRKEDADAAAKKAKDEADTAAKKAKNEADAAAKKAKEEAAKKARDEALAEYERVRKEYERSIDIDAGETYSNRGGERGYVNPDESRGLTVYSPPGTSMTLGRSAVNKYANESVSSISTSMVSTGKSRVDDYMDNIVTDRNGNIIFMYNNDDNVFYKRDDD